MKMKMLFATILLSGLMLNTGCQKVKSLLDVKFNANYTVNLNMTVPPASGSVKNALSAFSGSASIDPTSNSEVSKYLHLIKSWTVNSITGTFNNVTKEAVLQNGTLTFSNDAGTATWTFTNVQIKNGGTVTIDNKNGQLDKLSTILSSKKPFTVKLAGTTNKDGFSFTLSLEINSTVIANPLGAK